MIAEACKAIRYVEESGDTNRSRWPDSRLWLAVVQQLNYDLFEMRNFTAPDTIKRVHRNAHLDLLFQQSVGLLVTRAAIAEVPIKDLPNFAYDEAMKMAQQFKSDVQHFEGKLRRSAERYEATS